MFRRRSITNKYHKLLVFNLLLIAFLISTSITYHHYTKSLLRNGNWKSTKVSLDKSLLGAWSFMLTYRALANNHLDLGTWHGFQEISLKKDTTWEGLGFDLLLGEQAHIVLFYGKDKDTLEAVRISTDESYPAALLKIHNDAFLSKKALAFSIAPQKWTRVKVERKGDRMILFIDHKQLAILPYVNSGDRILAFRGSLGKTCIDNIELQDSEGNILFQDNFSIEYGHWNWLIICFLFANLIFLAGYRFQGAWITLAVNLSIIAALLTVFFILVGQKTYPPGWMINWQNKTSSIDEAANILSKLENQVDVELEDTTFHVFFIGSSQTWGAGASHDSNTFVSIYESSINRNIEEGSMQCVNGGISALNSSHFLEYYSNHWKEYDMDLIFINLGLNDSGNPVFGKNLRQFVKIANQVGQEVVFIQEPIISWRVSHQINIKVMDSIANDLGVICIPMHQFLRKDYDAGFLFWDIIHLTDYGHHLFANHLYKETQNLIDSLYAIKEKEEIVLPSGTKISRGNNE